METLRLKACTVDLRSGEVRRSDGRAERLTPRELELLAYLCRREGQAIPREELLERVWGFAPSVISRACDTTVRRLREKIEADPQAPDHVLTQFGEGYSFIGPDLRQGPEAAETEPFVGREGDVASLLADLGARAGLTTIVGPPGAGKTRLGRHLAWRCARLLPGGALFCEVAEATQPDEVVRAVARTLGLQLATGTEGALVRLGHALASQGPSLLVLDNCEQVLVGAAAVVAELLERAPELRVLATSREALGLDDEDVFPLGALEHDAAFELFVTLARRVRPDFEVAPDQRPVVDALVERLERLPLALSLAAGRVGALSPKHLLERIDERFRLLRSRARDVDPRQRTLLAAVDWSWDMLTAAERAALVQAACFRGGFDATAAVAVLDVPGDPAELLGRLVARSLLELRDDRYGGFAFIREYAERRLAEEPDVERATFLRHATYYAGLRESVPYHERPALLSPERHNLRAATWRSADLKRSDLAGAAGLGLLDVLGHEGPLEEVFAVAEAVLALGELAPRDEVLLLLRHVAIQQQVGLTDADERVDRALEIAVGARDRGLESATLRVRGQLNRQRGRVADAEADLADAAELGRTAGNDDAHANSLTSLGILYREQGRYEEARRVYEELIEVCDELDLIGHKTHAYGNLALLERRAGRFDLAREYYERSLGFSLDQGDGFSEAIAQIGLGNLQLDLGELDGARRSYERAGSLSRRLGLGHMEGQVSGNLGLVARAQGDLAAARTASERALEIFEATTNPREAAIARGNLGEVALLEGGLDEAEVQLSRAARTLRGLGDSVSEAELLGPLAEVALARGDLDRARAHLEVAEAESRRSGNPIALAQILCRRGLLEVALGSDARATLAEAEALAKDPGPASDVARLLDRLRARVGS